MKFYQHCFFKIVFLDIIVLIIKKTDYLVTLVAFNCKFDFGKVEFKVH